MLKRIATIKNVGAFKNCSARSVVFNKITLVYGRNTYGKSTLGDIFSALKTNNPQSLAARKSIPIDEAPQEIEMAFATDGENENQGKVLFRNGNWIQGLRNSHQLAVYDDGFYHSHVFTARGLTQDNKENFSDFVLGEQGVEKAQLIATAGQKKKDINDRKGILEKEVFNNIADLQDFLPLAVIEDIDSARKELEQARQEYAELLKQQREAEAIKARSNLVPLTLDTSTIDSARAINTVLEKKLENQHEAAKAELRHHIEQSFSRVEGAEQWIQQGLGYLTGDSCSFCGQSITPQVNELLDIYRQCFDDQYARHEGFVVSNFKRHRPNLHLNWTNGLFTRIEQADLIMQAYPELAADEGSKPVVEAIYAHHKEIRNHLEHLRAIGEAAIAEFAEACPLKLARPDKAVKPVALDAFSGAIAKLQQLVVALSSDINAFNHHANALKAKLEQDKVEKKLAELKCKGQSLAYNIQRFEKNDACNEYQQLIGDLNELNTDIPRLRAELAAEQTAYLTEYFEIINRYFRALGSREFTLEHGVSQRGNKSINFFKVLFRGQAIAEADLDKVFSESDRRSLSLAIFLSSLDSLDAAELAKTVVVLDDPVTSFDDHRVGQTHRKLVELADRCEQIILLSHFKEGIAHFLQVHGFSRRDIRVIEIIKDAQSSRLQLADPDTFVKSTHQHNTDELIDFIERRVDKLNCKPRVYLEDAIKLRFSKQIRQCDVTNESLSKRIDALRDNGIISTEVAQTLNRWREELNPEHHVWLGDDIENQRNTVAELLEFVFHQLVPAQ